ncbi:hypothetical protein Q6A77_04670, partial [Aliarcobacter skirrowii]|uniref:hypothetical protein n=1 Tax=Aliarcobacter skirrowii TaxID=28200 RepID=UPI0029BBE9A1
MKKKREITDFKRLKIDLLKNYRVESNFIKFINDTDKVSKNLMKIYIERLYKIELFKKYIVYLPFPKTITELKQQSIPLAPAINIYSAIYWEANVLKLFKKELTKFELLRNDFEMNFVNGNFINANNILDEIQSSFGYSLWIIENRMLLINYSEGFSELRKFVNMVLDDDNINGLLKLIVDFTSNKIDHNMNSKQYEEYIKDKFKELRKLNINPQLINYISFKLNCRYIEPISNYYDILSIESDSSIIDRYITFKQVAQQIDHKEYQDIFLES